MSEFSVQPTKDLTIIVGAQVSNALRSNNLFDNSVMVYGKTVTDGVITYKYQVSPDNVTWFDLVDDTATAVIPPLQDKAKQVDQGMFVYIRIASSAPVTAVNKVWNTSALT